MFFKNGANWELSGVMLTVGNLDGQPIETAVFGDQTFIADLSQYRSQILVVIPEPSSALLLLAGTLLLNRRRRPAR